MTSPARPLHGVVPYVGNGPYCYTNALVTVLGPTTPATAAVETLTSSAFGFQLLADAVPLFDPYGWNPDHGLDQAIRLLGNPGRRVVHDTAAQALDGLREHTAAGPVLVGPVDMGLLAHQPGSDRARGADHFVVALEVTSTDVVFHDPQGHPWVSLPHEVFCHAWAADGIGYTSAPYAMRTGIEPHRDVDLTHALTASLAEAAAWSRGRDLPVPPGTLGGADGLERLAEKVEAVAAPELLDMLSRFSIGVGTRRRADASACMARVGADEVASSLLGIARQLGALQHPARSHDLPTLADGLRRVADLQRDLVDVTARAVSVP